MPTAPPGTRFECGGQTAQASCHSILHGHFLNRLLFLFLKLTCHTGHHTLVAATMRRHGEHGCGQHRAQRQQSADEIERHREIGQRLTRPCEGNIRILFLAQVDEQHVRTVLGIDFGFNVPLIARHRTPHVGILEIDPCLFLCGGIGGCARISGGFHRAQRRPVLKTGQSRVRFAGQPSRGILCRCGGDANLFRPTYRHVHFHIVVNQTAHARVRYDITASGYLRLRRNRTTGLPLGGVHKTKPDGRYGEQTQDRCHHTAHQPRMVTRLLFCTWLVIHGFDLGFVCPFQKTHSTTILTIGRYTRKIRVPG